jgi:DNA-binding ferritin-like protein
MKRRTLKETFELSLVVEPNTGIVVDNMIAEWGGVRYAELSVLLSYLQFLNKVHHTHHWIAKGDPFYGDHLLFSRLYECIEDEIDMVAEKVVGLGSIHNVDIGLVTAQCNKLVQNYGPTSTVAQTSELIRRSYQVEMTFLKVAAHLVECLKECGLLTRGLDNMIAGIEDKHESHVYLLKQRCMS